MKSAAQTADSTSLFGEHTDEAECRRFQAAAEIAGRKWTALILLAGVRGAERFSEYRALAEGISDRVLSVRLKELEQEGLILREVTPTTPVQVRYRLTEAGSELIEVLHPLVRWGSKWRDA
ncbi:transcriptional regulator [Microterricola viridarii]|uniref:Transcriptional regulator n=1 Tax=Microterricola viridarii TaxID=412690 RepID=A0A0Y0Q1C7_9MICO|nr:transcriptional regulator [Microterricola viridarii]